LRLLQEGKIKAKGNSDITTHKYDNNESGYTKIYYNNFLTPNIWRSGLWSNIDNSLLPMCEAGLVPNYLESKIDTFINLKELSSFTYTDIKIDVKMLINEINYYRDTSSNCAGSGIFKKHNDKIELSYGGKTIMLDNTIGVQAIRVLLSLPKINIYYPILYHVAYLLKKGHDLDESVFSDAQIAVSKEKGEFYNKKNMDNFYDDEDEDRLSVCPGRRRFI
jgi:hypothetical protein